MKGIVGVGVVWLVITGATGLVAQDRGAEGRKDMRLDQELRRMKWSQVALVAATVGDVASSRGLVEQNPVIGRGDFGAKQAGLALGVAGVVVVVEWVVVRKWPETARGFKWVNWVGVAGHSGAMAHNWRQ